MNEEFPVITDFIGVLSSISDQFLWRPDCHIICGATRYQVVHSTTVSGGCQGEEDNRHNIRRYRQSHDCSAFYFFAAPATIPINCHRATETQRKKERSILFIASSSRIFFSYSLSLSLTLSVSVALWQFI